ncbi:hypothetical protein V8C40DRAFT_251808 [Trichoderma camerunense]
MALRGLRLMDQAATVARREGEGRLTPGDLYLKRPHLSLLRDNISQPHAEALPCVHFHYA